MAALSFPYPHSPSTGLSEVHFSSAVKQGLNLRNLVTVIAQGNLLFFYVNKQYIAQTRSGFSNRGKIGFMAFAISKPTDVMFTDAEVWKL